MIDMYFGNAGCGKTTILTALALKYSKQIHKGKGRYRQIWTNAEEINSSMCDHDDLSGLGSEYVFAPYSLLLWDETGIDHNNRSYKTFPKPLIRVVKKHRHLKIDMVLVSQDFEDVDITFRRMVNRLWYCRRLGPFTYCKRVYKYLDPDENGQFVVKYRYPYWYEYLLHFGENAQFFFRPFYYGYFDTYHIGKGEFPPPLPSTSSYNPKRQTKRGKHLH